MRLRNAFYSAFTKVGNFRQEILHTAMTGTICDDLHDVPVRSAPSNGMHGTHAANEFHQPSIAAPQINKSPSPI